MQKPGKTLKILISAAFLLYFAASAVSADHEKLIKYNNTVLSINRNNGFERSHDNGKTWIKNNAGLPVKIVYPFNNKEIRTITSLNINPDDVASLSLTTIDSLFISDNGGEAWGRIGLSDPVRPVYYITSSAVGGENGRKILLGTSFSGIFESTDKGKTWKSYSEDMQILSRGAGFYDDIAAVSYGGEKFRYFAATGFTKKLYAVTYDRAASSKSSWIEIVKHPAIMDNNISSLIYDKLKNVLEVYSGGGKYSLDLETMEWMENHEILPYTARKQDFSAQKRRTAAEGKTGIYLAAHLADGSSIDSYLDFIQQNNMNSIVVDFKDDNGIVTYETGLEMPAKLNAVRKFFSVKELVAKAHARDIYVIARMVVFKDKQLYSNLSGKYAAWDRLDNRPWGYFVKVDEETTEQKEFWVDPFSEDVWDYNISIAHELETLGVDEIQFDYIRFPTDGSLSRIIYRHRREGMSRSEALESFLKKVREKIEIPVSADLYGFNSWYKKGNWNGQQIDMFADYVDVICPMLYPSHFPAAFLSPTPFLQRAEQIYREGSSRAREIAAGRSIIRPFVQAFLIGNERNFEHPVYTQYLNVQLTGLFDAGAGGFTLWNASGNYYMVSNTMPVDISRKSQP